MKLEDRGGIARGLLGLIGLVVVIVVIVAIVSGGSKSKNPSASDPLVVKVVNVVAKPGNNSVVVLWFWNTGKTPVSADCGVWQYLPTTQGGNTPDTNAMVGSDTFSLVSPVQPADYTTPGRMTVQGRVVPRAESAFITITDPITESGDAPLITIGATVADCRPASQGQYDVSGPP